MDTDEELPTLHGIEMSLRVRSRSSVFPRRLEPPFLTKASAEIHARHRQNVQADAADKETPLRDDSVRSVSLPLSNASTINSFEANTQTGTANTETETRPVVITAPVDHHERASLKSLAAFAARQPIKTPVPYL